MSPSDLLETHVRLIPAQKSALKRLGIETIRDLLYHFPSRYDSTSESSTVANLASGTQVTLYGAFSKLEAKKLWKSRRNVTEGMFEDSTGKVKVLWFNQPYMSKYIQTGVPVKMTGTVAGKDKPYVTNPEVTPISKSAIPETIFEGEGKKETTELFPVYPESRGITSRWFYHTIKKVFASGVLEKLGDIVPENIRQELHLPQLSSALVYIHMPKNPKDAEAARKRFAFEEIFTIQLAKQIDKKENDASPSLKVSVDRNAIKKFTDTLPFSLTKAQEKSIEDILADFEREHPMARLLEGDVGSGKTAVAAATAYAAVTSRPPGRTSGTLQVAYMAPTEILAGQHFESFIELFKKLPINIGLITGSACYKFPSKINNDRPTKISRAQLLKWIQSGEIAMLVGTHALIQKAVEFQNLAYVVVDEQHRFGTRQRAALAKKGTSVPHFLSMTATPIPRTLALTIYGDLDISVLDELPKGRAHVETKLIKPDKREEAYAKVREELAAGRQAYIICPRIEEPDPEKALALRAKSARTEAKRLGKDVFPEYTVGLLHGKLKPKEKDEVMEQFSTGDIDILVATSVVEVGINVPNATVILIEGAERFGLSQLHQLRGRVQRSEYQPYCFLLPDTKSDVSLKRLRALAKTSNGFELAEEDLMLRGAGDLYGVRQWGISDIGMEALKNPKLIEHARQSAIKIAAHSNRENLAPELRGRIDNLSEKLHEE